jgi:hypothetical protein
VQEATAPRTQTFAEEGSAMESLKAWLDGQETELNAALGHQMAQKQTQTLVQSNSYSYDDADKFGDKIKAWY